MAEGNEEHRRRHTRFSVRLPVELGRSGARYELESENLSAGGVFLSTAEELCRPGDEVIIHITLPGRDGSGGERVALKGRVAHAIVPLGFGVCFELADDAPEREALLRYVDRLAAVRADVVDVLSRGEPDGAHEPA